MRSQHVKICRTQVNLRLLGNLQHLMSLLEENKNCQVSYLNIHLKKMEKRGANKPNKQMAGNKG